MTEGEKLLKLIEEMVELKVALRVGLPAGTKPDLVQLIAKKRHDDQHRLQAVREQIVQLFNACTQNPGPPPRPATRASSPGHALHGRTW